MKAMDTTPQDLSYQGLNLASAPLLFFQKILTIFNVCADLAATRGRGLLFCEPV